MESQVGTMVAASSRAQPTAGSLVARAAQGDADAFDTIARDAGDLLYRRALRILRNPADAQDATQAALIKAWRELPRLGDVGRFDAWLDRILVNTCRREGRRSSRWMLALSPAPEDDPSATQGFSAVAHRDQLERGFRRLPIEQREVVILHHYACMPLREVAEVLGIPTGTAHSRLSRAMQALRAALEADDRVPDAARATREGAP